MFETSNFELQTPNFEALNPKMSPEITNPNPQYWTPGTRSVRFQSFKRLLGTQTPEFMFETPNLACETPKF